ncbi:MAG: hypothetical protein AB6733_14975 [Clostridiaceae bacterium]
MKEVIYEYKDREEFWRNHKEAHFRNYEDSSDIQDIKKNKRQSFFYARHIQSLTFGAILANHTEVINELSLLGEEYAKIAIEKNQRAYVTGKRVPIEDAKFMQYDKLYYFRWINTGKEDIESLNETLKYAVIVAEKDYKKGSRYKKPICMNVVTYATKAGEFEVAREYLNKIYKRKKRQKLCKEIVYDMHTFYSYILEYLCSDKEDVEFKESLNQCFDYWFYELGIGNRQLARAYNSLYDEEEMAYVWYKYFSDKNWEEISPITIAQSIRYGNKT